MHSLSNLTEPDFSRAYSTPARREDETGEYVGEVRNAGAPLFPAAGTVQPDLEHPKWLGCNAWTPPRGDAHNPTSLLVTLPVLGKTTSLP